MESSFIEAVPSVLVGAVFHEELREGFVGLLDRYMQRCAAHPVAGVDVEAAAEKRLEDAEVSVSRGEGEDSIWFLAQLVLVLEEPLFLFGGQGCLRR